MRVIAGKAGGRKLQAPKGTQTRPTPDRVKEALFSILGPMLLGARVLDLYAGSGALGIEALSRGAAHATFVDQAKAAIDAMRINLAATVGALGPCHTVLPWAVSQALQHVRSLQQAFDIVLVDPPYAANLVPATLQLLVQLQLLAPGAIVAAEHDGKSPSPSAPPGLQCLRHRRYGDVAVSFYSPVATLAASAPTPQRDTNP